jgi:uncharacterized protein (DUF1684 family)
VLDWRRRVHALYADVRGVADPRGAHELWKAERDDMFAHHPASPLTSEQRATFDGLRYAAYDPTLRYELPVEPIEPRALEVQTATDGVVPFELVGVVRVPRIGELGVWWLGSYGGGVFVPVKDAGAGSTTYGGGRYLIDTVKGADLGGEVRDGWLVIDLNFAYNPSCAYDPAWACPLAPPENTIAVPLDAGEQRFPLP